MEEIVTVWTSGICLKCVFCHLPPVSITMPKCIDGLRSKNGQYIKPWCLAGLRCHYPAVWDCWEEPVFPNDMFGFYFVLRGRGGWGFFVCFLKVECREDLLEDNWQL